MLLELGLTGLCLDLYRPHQKNVAKAAVWGKRAPGAAGQQYHPGKREHGRDEAATRAGPGGPSPALWAALDKQPQSPGPAGAPGSDPAV